jgi:catechol 2,3-dioxygenase-like lactoylglutathione lyase family enzyme
MPTPSTLVGFDHLVFLVDDMDRALAFYKDVLGCVPGYSYPTIGMEQLWCGSALVVLWDLTHPGAAEAVPPVAGGRNVDHLCMATGPLDPDEFRAHMAEHGVAIEREAVHGGARGVGQSFTCATRSATCSRSRDLPSIPMGAQHDGRDAAHRVSSAARGGLREGLTPPPH